MAKITITKGRNYDLSIIVKQPESLNPLELTDTAEALFVIISKEDNKKILEKQMTRTGMPEDGKFLLQLDETETSLLPSKYAMKEDGLKPMDTCRGHVAITDTANPLPNLHHIDVAMPYIYVADLGE